MSRKPNFNNNQKIRPKSHNPSGPNPRTGSNSSNQNNLVKNSSATDKIHARPYTTNASNHAVLQNDPNYIKFGIGATALSIKPNLDYNVRQNHHLATQRNNANPVKIVRGNTNEIMQKNLQNNKPPLVKQTINSPKSNFKEPEEEKKGAGPKKKYSCSDCKKNFEKIIKIPKCGTHEWCEGCFKKNSKRIDCANCKLFFMSIEDLNSTNKNSSKIVDSAELKTENLKKCEICKSTSKKTFKNSKCNIHEYCDACFQRNPKKYDCTNCYSFFSSMESSHTSYYSCTLCDNGNESTSINCRHHKYCKVCCEFLLQNDYSHIKKVATCPYCNDCITKNKSSKEVGKSAFKAQQPSPEIQKRESPNVNQHLIVDSAELKTENLKKCEICNKTSKKTFKNSKCNMHEYCDACFQRNPKKNDCTNCYSFFSSMESSYTSKYSCTLCDNRNESTSINCRQHKFCKVCCEFLLQNDFSHIKKVATCPYCNDCITKNKSSKEVGKSAPKAQQPSPEIQKHESPNVNQYPINGYSTYANPRSASNHPAHKSIIYSISSSCKGCHNASSKLYTTPRCKDHEYCNDCIKQGTRSNCDFCTMYFESLKRANSSNTFQCSLCKISPENQGFKCKTHSFCKFCYEYLIKNDHAHIIKVANCQECNDCFKKLRNPEANKAEAYSTKPNSAGIIEKLKTDQQSHNKNEVVKNNGYNNNTNPRSSSVNADIRSSIKVSSGSCKGCYEYSVRLFTTPRCKDHEFCIKCIKKGVQTHCDLCKMYFESLRRANNQSTLQCTLCKIGPNNTEIKCKLHSYCKFCYEYLVKNDYAHITKVADCQECNECLYRIKQNSSSPLKSPQVVPNTYNGNPNYSSNKYSTVNHQHPNLANKEIPNNENLNYHLSYLQQNPQNITQMVNNFQNNYPYTNHESRRPNTQPTSDKANYFNTVQPNKTVQPSPSIKNLTIKCSNCNCTEGKIKGFLCNHNICIKCLTMMCFYQLEQFFEKYDANKPESIYKFSYYCTIINCHKPISVPTKLLINTLNKYLSDPQENQNFNRFHRLVYGNALDPWISIFDGLVY